MTCTISAFQGSRASTEPYKRQFTKVVYGGLRCNRRNRCAKLHVTANLTVFSPEEIELESSLGTVGFMNVSSYAPSSANEARGLEGLGMREVQQLAGQDLSEGGIQVRLYTGRVVQGRLMGTRVTLKAYPTSALKDADAMAANELAAHASLQPPAVPAECDQLVKLLGGFQVSAGASAGEQWLVFRNTGTLTAAQYALKAAEASQAGSTLGDGEFWDKMDSARPLLRRHEFILSILRQMLGGLAYMHARKRLHQSVGPSSVVLSTTDEMQWTRMSARLKDLAFAVDVSDEALFGGPTLGDIWDRGITTTTENPLSSLASDLWRRARQNGAWSELDRRNFGIADDIYAAGLLLAYMAFVPLCEPGSIDGPSLQRLLESTFRLDISAVREYCEADDRWQRAVAFLDYGDGSGWDLLQAMLNPEWRLRPTAASCLNHPFLTGKVATTPSQQ